MLLRLGIDIDGVLYPWADAANRVCMRRFGIADPGPHTSWYHLKGYLDAEQWQWVWSREGMRLIFGDHARYPGVEAFGTLLASPKLECHFATHRDPAALGVITASYLRGLYPDASYAGLHVCKSTEKAQILGWDFFIDDKQETVLDMLTYDVDVFMPRRPWNVQAQERYTDWDGFHPYDDPQEVVDYLMERLTCST